MKREGFSTHLQIMSGWSVCFLKRGAFTGGLQVAHYESLDA